MDWLLIILLIEEKNGRFAVCGLVAGIVSLLLALRGVMLGFLPWVCALIFIAKGFKSNRKGETIAALIFLLASIPVFLWRLAIS